MHKFKNNVSDGWLFKQELRFFRNFAANWNRDVEDCDFFDIFANTANTSEEEAKAFIGSRFDHKELDKIDAIRLHRNEGVETDEFELRGNIDGIIRDIWNHKGWRDECRAMLMEWCDLMEKRKTRRCKRKDPMELRMDEICRVLKLNEVEREVLSYAAVRAMTCFDDFPVGCCNGRHDRELYCAMALENVKRMKPRKGKEMELIDKLMKPHCELMNAKPKDDKLLPSKDYSLDGLNITGDIGLGRIVEAVRKFRNEKDDGVDPDRPRMNLLLWGPPGTGKTEFIKYLGKELNAKVLVKMGSDLLSMYVGGTEQNIKRAFAEAEADNAILFLDEIDGLVQDRSGASKSWEVTQVNDLLYQMENFKGVMVGATNFMDNLDQAIMRRFTFKLQFDYLDEAGKRLFFERMFKTQLTDADAAKLAEVRNLAPGDFRTVRQSMYYLGGTVTNAQRIAELEKESSVKRDTKKAGKIGF